MKGTETHKRKETDYFRIWSPSVFQLNVWLVPLTRYSECCRKQIQLLISTSLLLISDRNLYAQVPHFSKVKVSARLINDAD